VQSGPAPSLLAADQEVRSILLGWTLAVPCFLFVAGIGVYKESLKSVVCMTLIGWAACYLLFFQALGIISYRGVHSGVL